MGRTSTAFLAFAAFLVSGCASGGKGTAAGAGAGAAAGMVLPAGTDSSQIFKNEWCFCILPTIIPERPASRSNIAYAIATGRNGRVFLAGTEPRGDETIGSGWTVRAVDLDGTVAWSRSYTSQRNYYDVARSLASCPKDRIAVAGYSEFSKNSITPARWLVEAYSADGGTLWSDEFGENGMARAESASCDPAGRLAVAGWMSRGPASKDTWGLVRSYGPEGKLLWSRTFGGILGGKDRATAVVACPDSSVLVAGREDEGGARSAWRLIRFSPTGAVAWSRSYYGPSPWQDEPAAVAVADDGRIAMAGKVSGGTTEHMNWRVMLLDRDGVPVWTRDHNGPKGLDDKAFAVAFDRKGRLIVAGYEDGDASQAPPYDAGEWAAYLYGKDGKVMKKLGAAELGTKPGSAFALAFRGQEVLVAGFEQLDDVGKTRWLSRKLEGME